MWSRETASPVDGPRPLETTPVATISARPVEERRVVACRTAREGSRESKRNAERIKAERRKSCVFTNIAAAVRYTKFTNR